VGWSRLSRLTLDAAFKVKYRHAAATVTAFHATGPTTNIGEC
jgi:hypothetical protein